MMLGSIYDLNTLFLRRYFPLLKPYVDHVPVKADMSDLQEKLEWQATLIQPDLTDVCLFALFLFKGATLTMKSAGSSLKTPSHFSTGQVYHHLYISPIRRCHNINARGRYICRDGILDYMQAICYEISVRTRRPPSWLDPFQYAVDGLVGRNADPPKVDLHGERDYCCKVGVTCHCLVYCTVCFENNNTCMYILTTFKTLSLCMYT